MHQHSCPEKNRKTLKHKYLIASCDPDPFIQRAEGINSSLLNHYIVRCALDALTRDPMTGPSL
jgi:hypothetical protein